MKRPSLRFLTSQKFWQRSAFALACLATLIAAAYAMENYRGERAWAHYRTEAGARGEKLDFKDFIPAPIPDEENFAAIPIYRELLSSDAAVRSRANEACEFPKECMSLYSESFTSRTPPDFVALRDCLVKNSSLPGATDDAVSDVLRALERYEPVFAQLRSACERPRSRLDSEWEKGFDAAFWRTNGAVQIGKLVSLRVSVLLAAGRTHDAVLDWRTGCRHAGIFQGEPTLLASMLRVILVSISTDGVLDGLAMRAWSEDELKSISNDLSSIDLMSDFTFGMASERALMNGVLDQMRANPSAWSRFVGGNPDRWLNLIPAGWFAQNQRHLNEWYDEQIAGIETPRDRSALKIQIPNFDLPKNWIRFPYWFVVGSAAFMLGDNVVVCRETQANVDLCMTACALERFRLRNGDYPKALRELVPDMLHKLTRDRFDGEPLRYRRTSEGGVILYSVGKDCHDDGGNDAKDVVCHLTTPDANKANPATPAKSGLHFGAYDGDPRKTVPEDMSFHVIRLDVLRPPEFLKQEATVTGTKLKLNKSELKASQIPKGDSEDLSELTLGLTLQN